MSTFVTCKCRPDEVQAVLTLWQQAEATPDVSDTVEDLTHAIVNSPALVFVAEAHGA